MEMGVRANPLNPVWTHHCFRPLAALNKSDYRLKGFWGHIYAISTKVHVLAHVSITGPRSAVGNVSV